MPPEPPRDETLEWLDESGRALMQRLHGERAASRMMRTFGIKFSVHHPDPATVKSGFIQCGCVEDWRAVIETNLTGVFLVAQAVARRMIPRGAGKIILPTRTADPATSARGTPRNVAATTRRNDT